MEELEREFKYRKTRCDDCGFTKGTKANLNGVTEIKANLCAEIPDVFLCHFNAKDDEVEEGKEVLCQGWVETCNKLDAQGFYQQQPAWQRELKIEIVEAITEIENNQTLSEQEMIDLVNSRIRDFLAKK